MAKQLYRPANQHTLLWIFIGLCGVAGLLLTLFSLDALGLTDGFEIGSFLLSTIPFIAAIAFGVWLLGRFNRTRVSGISALLEPEGFLFSSQPTEKSKTTFYPSMSGILASWQMDRGSDPLQWIAMIEQAENRMAIFEYMYSTGSGKTYQEHALTVVAWPASHPMFPVMLTESPPIQLMKLPWWSRRVWNKEVFLKISGLESFQKEWMVIGHDDTARKVLTPTVIGMLGQSPRGTFWYMGQGWACAAARFTVDATNLRSLVDHSRNVLQRVRSENLVL